MKGPSLWLRSRSLGGGMNMTGSKQQAVWVCLVDDRQARLLRGQRLDLRGSERLHLDLVASHPNPFEEREHDVRVPQTGKEGHSDADRKHRRAEFQLRWARDLGRWLGGVVEEHRLERVHVFVPPGLLGSLRRECDPNVRGRLDELRGDLARLGPGELARHPSITALFATGD